MENEFHRRKRRRHGVLMIVLGWALAFFMVTLYYRSVLLERDNPNRLSVLSAQAGELSLRRDGRGHYTLEGFMNGKQVVYLLDTGATSTAVPGRLADSMALPRQGAVQIKTASGVTDAAMTRIETMTLGPYQLHDLRAAVIDEMPGDTVLLGMNALKYFDLTQRGDTLTLVPAAAAEN